MGYQQDSIFEYLEEVRKKSPTPGGGSVSALVAALGASLGCMVANFTTGKKYENVEDAVKEILLSLEELQKVQLTYCYEDVDAYDSVSDAFKLPKETEEQKSHRKVKIQEGLKSAMDVPLKGVRNCLSILQSLWELSQFANPNLITDLGCAALLSLAALKGCKFNVEINLTSIKDEELVEEVTHEIEETSQQASFLTEKILHQVAEKL